eukprot:XP_008671988.1 uncharacterized protein LOC103649506 [Zea mays]
MAGLEQPPLLDDAATQVVAEHEARLQAAARRDAALAQALQAEQEAATAAQERDVAAERVRAALERAAHARALAAQTAADGSPVDDNQSHLSDPAGGADKGLHDAILLHEAAAIVNLHSQAVAVQNIRSLVHVVLDLANNNYTRWRDEFLLVTGKYSLDSHILDDTPAPHFPDWAHMDCIVKSWISGSISPDLAEMAMERGATARTTWLTLENQFLGNRETRALHLDAQFRHFVQGDLPVSDYCRRFKTMADALGDLGEPVTDRTLVLNVLRGLSDRFSDIGRHLRLGRPFPTFHDVRATLLLEELTMAHRVSSPSAALLTSTKPPQGGTSTASNKAPAASNKAPSAPRSGHPNRRSKRGGQGRQGILPFPGTGPGSQHGSASGLWPSLQNPWTGAIQMWPGPRAPTPQQQQGLLAQHQALLPPTAQQQQAFYAAPVSIAPH